MMASVLSRSEMANVFFHSTVWEFCHPGELIQRFHEIICDPNVMCTYLSETKMFRIEFPEPGHETDFWRFVDLCDKYIDEFCNVSYNAIDDEVQIVRQPETGGCSDLQTDIDKLIQGDDDDESPDGNLIDYTPDSLKQEHEENRVSWTPKLDGTDIVTILPDWVLQNIAADTACALELSVQDSCVFIANATDSKVQTVCRKLDNVERNSARQMVTSHFLRMEKDHEGRLQLRRLQHLKDGTLRQTLTPYDQGYTPLLHRYRVIRTARLDEDEGKQKPAGKQFTTNKELLKSWRSVKLPHFVKEGMHESLLGGIEEWIQQTYEQVQEDGSDLMGGQAEILEGEVLVPTKAPRTEQAENLTQDLDFPEEDEILESFPTPNPDLLIDYASEEPQLSATSRGVSPPRLESALTFFDDASSRSSIPPSSMQPALSRGIKFTDKIAKASWDVIAPAPTPAENSQPVYTGDSEAEPFPPLGTQRPRPRVQLPSRPPPGLQLQPSSTNAFLVCANDASDQYSQVARTQVQAVPELASDVVETIQVEDEVSSRRYFKTTPHQKGKKAKQGPNKAVVAQLDAPEWDPRVSAIAQRPSQGTPRSQVPQPPARQAKPVVLPECSKDVREILQKAMSFSGHLAMEISIGRILMHGFSRDEVKAFADTKAVSADFMAKGLKDHFSSTNSRIYFVERLTSSINEACQIPAGDLFKQEPALEESWFEFKCESQDQGRQKLSIKVKGEQQSEVSLNSNSLGQVFFHFPKRKWDARFSVTGQLPYEHSETTLKFLETVSAQVRDYGSERRADLRFRVTSDMNILSVQAKRRLTFEYLRNSRIKLHVTEVQIMSRSWKKDDTSFHQAQTGDRSAWIAAGQLWYEAKLTISAESFFDQNLDLGTGDDAAWEPEEVLDDKLLCDMQNVIDHLVSRLDGVGLQNKGLRGHEEDMLHLESLEKKSQAGRW